MLWRVLLWGVLAAAVIELVDLASVDLVAVGLRRAHLVLVGCRLLEDLVLGRLLAH